MWGSVFLLVAICVNVCKLSITFPNSAESDNETSSSGVSVYSNNLGLTSARLLGKGFNNIILSPWNIYTCLGILQLGAGGRTKAELSLLLGPNINPGNISSALPLSDGVTQANAVFMDSSVLVKPEFPYELSKYYQAPVFNVSFTETQETQDSINRWVAYQTNGSITDLLREPLDSTTLSVVVSTIYFSGQWMYPFSVDFTKRGLFTVADEVLEVDFMRTNANFPIYKNDHLSSIALPYKSSELTMHLVLPHAEGLSALQATIAHLTPDNIDKLVQLYVQDKAIVVIPKVKVSAMYNLKNILKKQGLETIFNPFTANLTGITEDKKIYLMDVYHSVYLEMTEHGTIAAAATGGILVRTASFTFRADRPFIFFIRHRSGIVLFMGVIARPI